MLSMAVITAVALWIPAIVGTVHVMRLEILTAIKSFTKDRVSAIRR